MLGLYRWLGNSRQYSGILGNAFETYNFTGNCQYAAENSDIQKQLAKVCNFGIITATVEF